MKERITELRSILKYMHDIALAFRDEARQNAQARASLEKNDAEKALELERQRQSLLEQSRLIAGMEQRQEDLEKTNQELRDKNAKLEAQYSHLLHQHEKFTENATTQHKALEEKYQIIKAVDSIRELERLRQEWQQGLEQNRLDAASLREGRERLQREQASHAESAKDLKAREELLELRKAEFAEERRQHEAELNEARRVNTECQLKMDELEARQAELDKLKEKLDADEDLSARLLEEERQKIADLDAKKDDLKEREASLREKEAALQAEKDNLQDEMRRQERATKEQQRLATDYTLKLNGLKDREAELERKASLIDRQPTASASCNDPESDWQPTASSPTDQQDSPAQGTGDWQPAAPHKAVRPENAEDDKGWAEISPEDEADATDSTKPWWLKKF